MSETPTEVEEYVVTSGWDSVTLTLTRRSGPTEPLSDADKALLAWQGPFPPCRTCGQTQNHRCTTPTGALTSPHQHRRDMVAGYLARSPEIAALKDLMEANSLNQLVSEVRSDG